MRSSKAAGEKRRELEAKGWQGVPAVKSFTKRT
jgi:hypothetical protein